MEKWIIFLKKREHQTMTHKNNYYSIESYYVSYTLIPPNTHTHTQDEVTFIYLFLLLLLFLSVPN